MMMKIIKLLIIFVTAISLCSCDDDDTNPYPSWAMNDDVEYTTSMSAVLTLPPSLNKEATEADLLVAFIGDECRGIGELILKDDIRYYFLTIKGYQNENGRVVIRYYNTKKSYLFTSGEAVDFKPDGLWGVLDEPIVLDLHKESQVSEQLVNFPILRFQYPCL